MTADAAARDVLADRISEIEEAYEFMLSHAAQGHQSAITSSGPMLEGIGAAATAAAGATGADPAIFRPFMATLDDDARKAGPA